MNPRYAASIQKLSELCTDLGGRLVLFDDDEQYKFNDAMGGVTVCGVVYMNFDNQRRDGIGPSNTSEHHGLNWFKRTVYAMREHAHPGTIIHEMGHVFCDQSSKAVENSNEIEWLGWEILVARITGCWRAWNDQNAGYIIDDSFGFDWVDLKGRNKRDYCAERIAFAKSIGVVSRRGKPLSRRIQR